LLKNPHAKIKNIMAWNIPGTGAICACLGILAHPTMLTEISHKHITGHNGLQLTCSTIDNGFYVTISASF